MLALLITDAAAKYVANAVVTAVCCDDCWCWFVLVSLFNKTFNVDGRPPVSHPPGTGLGQQLIAALHLTLLVTCCKIILITLLLFTVDLTAGPL
jgi:hypothetical protein